jgi:hypothetical protein
VVDAAGGVVLVGEDALIFLAARVRAGEQAGQETDPTVLLGWAGWDHAQQSLALSLVIEEREKDGLGRRAAGPAGGRASGAAAVGRSMAQWG